MLTVFLFTEDSHLGRWIDDYKLIFGSFNLEKDDLSMRHDIRPVLQVSHLGHAMHAFVNGKYIGSGHGTKIEKSFVFQKPMDLQAGTNDVAILGMTVGLPVKPVQAKLLCKLTAVQ